MTTLNQSTKFAHSVFLVTENYVLVVTETIVLLVTKNSALLFTDYNWHCEDLGIRHIYIKKASPHLNGKVERSHLTDQNEFYQLLEYKDDIDIEKKLKEWENFYNCHRPNGALKGKTPYEVLKEKLTSR